MKSFTLTNEFHGTSASVRTSDSGVLSDAQRRRIRKALCGIAGCTCGGELSERGRQDVEIRVIGYDGDKVQLQLVELDPSYR